MKIDKNVILGILGGAAIGGAVVNLYWKSKVNKIIEETVAETVKAMGDVKKSEEKPDDVNIEDIIEKTVNKAFDSVMSQEFEPDTAEEYEDEDDYPTDEDIAEEEFEDYKKEVERYVDEEESYVIDASTVGVFPYDVIYTWIYYADKVLATEENELLDDYLNYIPAKALEILDEDREPEQLVDVVYVVNHKEQCYFEILKDLDVFDEAILKSVSNETGGDE